MMGKLNMAPHPQVLPDAASVLETLPLSVVLLNRDGSLCHANASARRLAAVVHRDPQHGLAQLTARAPTLRDGAAANDCEDCFECMDESGHTLNVVRQWRACGNSGLRSVTIRPARTQADDLPPSEPARYAPVEDRTRSLSEQQHLIHADKLATVGQLAAGMAHEINNPVCYVQSNLGTFRDYLNKLFGLFELCDQLLRDDSMSANQRLQMFEARKRATNFALVVADLPALLEESREGVERIRQIVQNLRDFSRTDPTETFRLFDVHRAIDTTLEIVRSLSSRGIRFTTYFEHLPLIECNPTELNQVLMNILVNATQAVTDDGAIEIHTGGDQQWVWIEVTDNGCGVDAHTVTRIFEPFFTTKEVGRGTGLGLSISYGIIRKHGGDIDVRSQPGEGTTFRITLPVKQGQTPTI